jgi:hypothetical protein
MSASAATHDFSGAEAACVTAQRRPMKTACGGGVAASEPDAHAHCCTGLGWQTPGEAGRLDLHSLGVGVTAAQRLVPIVQRKA